MIVKTRQKNENKSIGIITICLVFALVFYNNETFPSIYFNGPIETVILLTLCIVVFFFFSILVKNKKVDKRSTLVILILASLILITMLLNSDFIGGYGKIIMGLLIGYMMVNLVSREDFIEVYLKVMIVLAIYSLFVTYLIRPITFAIPEIIFPRIYNSVGLPFIDTRLSVVVNIPSYYRNFGIFREPGVYQIFLNFALIFELFFKRVRVNPLNVMIFYITIVSTFSTPGYISGAMIIIAFILFSDNKFRSDNIRRYKRILLIFLIIILISTILLYLSNDIFRLMFIGTFNKLIMQQSSFEGRLVAIYANLSSWIERPIWGHGITRGLLIETLEKMKSNYQYSTSHNTSTIGALLASFGLGFTTMYIFLIYKLISSSNCNKISKVVIFLAIMIAINTQLLIYNELLYTIIAFGITTNDFIKRKV